VKGGMQYPLFSAGGYADRLSTHVTEGAILHAKQFEQVPCRPLAHGNYQVRIDECELPHQVRAAGAALPSVRAPVPGRAALDHAGDKHLSAFHTYRSQQFIQDGSRSPHEG
jgi:hypothetical protein